MIDARAVVSGRAHLHQDVSVGPYSIIGPDVKIAKGTKIESHVVLKGPCVIGEDNRIFQFASIGDDPQDKKYAGEVTELVIGDRNTIREYCTINRGTVQGGGTTRVGDDNWIMAYVHIAHDCVVGNQTVLANNTTLAGHVHIGDWALLGGFTGVHQYCRIGAHALTGIFTAVTKDISRLRHSRRPAGRTSWNQRRGAAAARIQFRRNQPRPCSLPDNLPSGTQAGRCAGDSARAGRIRTGDSRSARFHHSWFPRTYPVTGPGPWQASRVSGW